MLIVYTPDQQKLRKEEAPPALPPNPVWIDLLNPSREEELLVEQALRLDLPTRDEMKAIEVSSRLYKEGEALFMTAPLLAGSASALPEASPVTFVLAHQCLITIRYSDFKSFQLFSGKAQQHIDGDISKESILTGLLESVVNRLADILEDIAANINAVSQEIFMQENKKASRRAHKFHDSLRLIAQKGDMNSIARESLVGLGRLLTFLAQGLEASPAVTPELRGWITTLSYDITALTDYVSFISNKISFLLDATLGMISIEQNTTIKIFSVAAVIFLPPTLVASVYGMNFQFMPELKWHFGYPYALTLMVFSAIVPYWYFKRRGWL